MKTLLLLAALSGQPIGCYAQPVMTPTFVFRRGGSQDMGLPVPGYLEVRNWSTFTDPRIDSFVLELEEGVSWEFNLKTGALTVKLSKNEAMEGDVAWWTDGRRERCIPGECALSRVPSSIHESCPGRGHVQERILMRGLTPTAVRSWEHVGREVSDE